MNYKLLPLLTLLVTPLLSQAASEGYFAEAELLYELEDNEVGYGAKFGYAFGYGGSLDLEIGYFDLSDSAADSGTTFSADLTINPILINYVYTVHLDDGISSKRERFSRSGNGSFEDGLFFFLGGGAGVSFVDLDVSASGALTGSGSDSDTLFTTQLLVGLGYAFSDTVSVSLGYRYIFFEDAELFGFESDDLDTSVLSLGLRFAF